MPEEVDFGEAVSNWQNAGYEMDVVEVSGRRFHSALEIVSKRVRTALTNSSEALVLGVQEGGPYAVAMHTALSRESRVEPVTITAVTIFSNLDPLTAGGYPERQSLEFLEKSAAVETLGVNRMNTINVTDRRSPKRQFLRGASVFPISIITSVEDAIANAVTNRRGAITGRIAENRMRLR